MKNCYSELVIFNTVDLEIKGLKLLFLGSNGRQWTFFHASFTGQFTCLTISHVVWKYFFIICWVFSGMEPAK